MSLDLEGAVIGAVLNAEGGVLNTTGAALFTQAAMRGDDFTQPRPRLVWEVMTKLHERRRPLTLANVLQFVKLGRVLDAAGCEWLVTAANDAVMMDRERFGELVDALRGRGRARPHLQTPQPALARCRRGCRHRGGA